jgi:polar amino acid transport system substrate-binding protein
MRAFFYFLCSLLLASQATARHASPVLVQVDDNNPPFMFVAGEQAAGIYPALIKAVFYRAGIPVVVQAKPWVRVLHDMDRGQGGIGGAYRTTERAAKWDFSAPLLTENIAVFMRKDADWTFTAFSDLNGRTIGTVRGWSYGESFDTARAIPLLTAEDTQSDRINLRKLASGRLDAVLAIEEAGLLTIKDMGIGNLRPAAHYLASNPAHIAFPKSSKRDDLLHKLNKAIAELKHEGEFNRIVLAELNRVRPDVP